MSTICDRVWIVDSSADGKAFICVKDFERWDPAEQLRFIAEFKLDNLAYSTKLEGLHVYCVDSMKANHFVTSHQFQPLPVLAHWLQKVVLTLMIMSNQMDAGLVSTNRQSREGRKVLQIISEVKRVARLVAEVPPLQAIPTSATEQPKDEADESTGGSAEDLESTCGQKFEVV
ncbi:unnamed protein product [Calypogeia fissa]